MSDNPIRAAISRALNQRYPNCDNTATAELVHGHLVPIIAEHNEIIASSSYDLGYRYGSAAAFGALWGRAHAERNTAVAEWLTRVGFAEVFGAEHCAHCHGYDDHTPHEDTHTARSGVHVCPACPTET